MIITPVPHGLEGIVGVSTGHRSPGLHMSDLYGSLYADLYPKRYTKGAVPNPLYLEAGLAFEEMLEEKFKRRLGPHLGERPDEQFTSAELGGVAGIAYSPDLLIFDDQKGLILGEIKLSWQSSREVPRTAGETFPPKFDRYFTQIMAYCFHLQTIYARLFVFFVNGYYQPPTPEFLAWDLTFTQRELDECWAMLRNHGRSKGLI